MAEIFDQSTAYDGSSSPTTGSTEVHVNFAVNKKYKSRLQLFTRENGNNNHAYKCIKTCYESEEFKVDLTGDQYYWVWKLLSSDTVTGSLAVT